MLSYATVLRFIAAGFVISLAMICVLTAGAQSGRRAKPTAPVPVPTPEATPTPAAPAEKPKPAVTFIVGLDRYGDFSRVPLNAYSGVLRSCSERLDDSLSVKAQEATADMTRGDAIRQAKAEKEAYIVWLQLRPTFPDQVQVNDDSYGVYIEYTVFAPTTAKQVASGHTYPEAYRNRRVRVPTSSINGDYYLNQAARGAAERILAHFHLRISSTLP